MRNRADLVIFIAIFSKLTRTVCFSLVDGYSPTARTRGPRRLRAQASANQAVTNPWVRLPSIRVDLERSHTQSIGSGHSKRYHAKTLAGKSREVEDVTYDPGSSARLLSGDNDHVRLFEEWAKQVGCGGAAALSHADFEGLRGLVANTNIRQWKRLASIPMSQVITEFALSFRLSSPPPEPISAEAWKLCPWWVRLGVRLLEEKKAGHAARFKEYLGILPKTGEFDTPLNWSQEQLMRVHYPRLRAQVALQRRLFRGDVTLLVSPAETIITCCGVSPLTHSALILNLILEHWFSCVGV